MADYPNKSFKKWSVLDIAKLNLMGEPLDKSNPKQRPNLKVAATNNMPRIRLYLNNGTAGGGASIPFALDPVIWSTFLTLIEDAADNKEPSRTTIEIKSGYDHKGNKLDKIDVVGKIMVGRNPDGVVYVALGVRGEDVANFPFTMSYFAEIVDDSGEKLNAGRASEVVAKSWTRMMRDIMAGYLVTQATEPKKKEDGGGSGGGSNWGGGSGGGNSGGGW